MQEMSIYAVVIAGGKCWGRKDEMKGLLGKLATQVLVILLVAINES